MMIRALPLLPFLFQTTEAFAPPPRLTTRTATSTPRGEHCRHLRESTTTTAVDVDTFLNDEVAAVADAVADALTTEQLEDLDYDNVTYLKVNNNNNNNSNNNNSNNNNNNNNSINDKNNVDENRAEAVLSSPGIDECTVFDCDPSVVFWRNFQQDGALSAERNLQEVASTARRLASSDPQYLATHAARVGYFAANALLGTAAFQLHERLFANNASNGDSNTATTGSSLPFDMDSIVATRIVLEAFLSFEQDQACVEAGAYRAPWDMEDPNPVRRRQWNPVYVATQTGRFVREAVGTMVRRNRGNEEDRRVSMLTTTGAKTSMYPEYYNTAFHYQTDGWMSTRSANAYETSTETLFLGRQDAMQRTSLPSLVSLSKDFERRNQRPMRVLEVACGTGRFMTFVRDNLPLDAEYTAVDLSPFYLEKAAENDAEWRKAREAEERGKNSGSTEKIAPAKLIQAQAENLPFPSSTFDAIVCVYLFHELPRPVRQCVVSEMARVLSPGGRIVLTDSVQRGDRPTLDHKLGNFEKMNEPFYNDYVCDYLPGYFEKVGLRPLTKVVRSTTKSISFQKES